jgi:hypothetical protein
MRCRSSSGQPSGLLFQKRLAPSRQRNGTTREGKRISASHAERKHGTGPEEDHSRSRSARSNSRAECRDKWDRHRAEGGDFSLDIPFYRTSPVERFGVNRELTQATTADLSLLESNLVVAQGNDIAPAAILVFNRTDRKFIGLAVAYAQWGWALEAFPRIS